MRVLLDTQVVYIAAGLGETALPPKVRELLSDDRTDRLLSAASLMEIAIKSGKGVAMTKQHCEKAIKDLDLTLVPFSADYAYRLFSLPAHHRDPFDRMLIATALVEGVPVLSGDRAFRQYRGLKVIW